ncbi:nucleotidyltransferase family protein [Mucilaginibacter sp. KACC 22063]|uniref:nucleotidyltransferase family protein n=1 Tax=Mucilaginibacter sp. KACC 22063 TaxID=3025666 RepID=UPI002366C023|nr:nucleotidyltransferase domain-containing protein [Mucilaginibacter sp. KACC 22063]WDF56602.1 nucleotidyltransferase domain-containing protein [Mucilaginibacter sp. KACC 22063]
MKFGLSNEVIEKIRQTITTNPKVEEIIVYGSRAKGNYKSASDIDITLKGDQLVLQDLNKLAIMLDDLLLPQKIDLSIYHHISNADLLEHIERIGQPL